MIEITSAQISVGAQNNLDIEFIMFNKIVCSCSFYNIGFKDWSEIKSYIENQLTEDFKNASVTKLEGKPSNLKTK